MTTSLAFPVRCLPHIMPPPTPKDVAPIAAIINIALAMSCQHWRCIPTAVGKIWTHIWDFPPVYVHVANSSTPEMGCMQSALDCVGRICSVTLSCKPQLQICEIQPCHGAVTQEKDSFEIWFSCQYLSMVFIIYIFEQNMFAATSVCCLTQMWCCFGLTLLLSIHTASHQPLNASGGTSEHHNKISLHCRTDNFKEHERCKKTSQRWIIPH